jgi:hypothetical protein
VLEVVVPAIAVIVAAALGVLGQRRRAEEASHQLALQEVELIERLQQLGLHDSAERVAQSLDSRTRLWTTESQAWYRDGVGPGWRFFQLAIWIFLGGLVLDFVAVVFLGDDPVTLNVTALGRTGRTLTMVAVSLGLISVAIYGIFALVALLLGRHRPAPRPLLAPLPARPRRTAGAKYSVGSGPRRRAARRRQRRAIQG